MFICRVKVFFSSSSFFLEPKSFIWMRVLWFNSAFTFFYIGNLSVTKKSQFWLFRARSVSLTLTPPFFFACFVIIIIHNVLTQGILPLCLCCAVLSLIWLLVTPWTLALQGPLSMGFSRQEHWSGLPFLSSAPLTGKLKFRTLEAPGLVEVSWFAILDLFGYNQFMSYSQTVSFF